MTVTLVGADPTSALSIDFTVQFTEDVFNFTAGDVTFGGGANPGGASLSTVDANTYTVAVTGMTTTGTVTVSIAADVAQDGAGNLNTASNEASVQWNQPVPQDTQAPSVTVTPGVASPTSSSPIPFTVEFSEDVTGFADGDVVLTGPPGSTASVSPVDGNTYTVSVSGMTAAGTVSVSVPAGVAQDAAQNANVASNTASVEFVVAPGPLVLNLPGNIVRNNDPGQAGAVVTFNASASGGAPPVVVVCTPASGSFFPIGTTTVNCTATDADEGLDEAIVSGILHGPSDRRRAADHRRPPRPDANDDRHDARRRHVPVADGRGQFRGGADGDVRSGVGHRVPSRGHHGDLHRDRRRRTHCVVVVHGDRDVLTIGAADHADDHAWHAAADGLLLANGGRASDSAGGPRPAARRRSAPSVQQSERLIDHVEAGVRIVEGDVARRHDVDPVGGDERPHAVLLAERGEPTHRRRVDRAA